MFIPLSRLLIEGRPENHPVAMRHGQTINFGEFRAQVAATASRFKSARCAVLVCNDSYNFAVGLYGLLHAGAKIILPAHHSQSELLQKEFDPFVNDAMIENSSGGLAALTDVDPTRLCLTFFTSGSTGTPKEILKNLTMLENEISVLDRMWGLGKAAVFATVPHQHIYGLTFKILWPLMAGRPFFAATYSMLEDLLQDMATDAFVISSPAHLERLDGIAPLSHSQRPSRIFSAGAALSLEASQQAEAVFGCRPTEIFGSTETGAFATRSQTNINEPWQLLPGIDMRCDVEGHLILRSPFIGPEWFTTADVVEPVERGFRSLGRADRIVKVEGKRVSLPGVEEALCRLPLIKAAAVTLLKGNPERLAAVLVLSEKGRIKLGEIGNFRFGRFIRSKLAVTQDAAGIPRLWRFTDELPMQGLGKKRDEDIRALFGEQA